LTYKEALEYLNSFGRLSPSEDLHRIKQLLNGLGNPQDKLKFIHIAGTNGKGSTAAFCASALIEAGYKTGLYISPYVISFNERIQINGQFIPDELLASVVDKVKGVVEAIPDSYVAFEVITAVAMEWFASNGCDIVVLETGLGGRLDATNVIMTSVVSVITSISYDHTELLGDTLEKIAYEKAQIIKSGGTVVLYPEQGNNVFDVISETAEKKRAKLIVPDLMYLRKHGHFFTYKGNDYIITLRGEYQVLNAITAIEALDEVSCCGFYNLTREKIALGLMKATMPARFETVSHMPTVILDGAHNPSGIENLAKTIASQFSDKKVTAVVAMLKDKNVKQMLSYLGGVITKAIATEVDNPRRLSASELCEMLNSEGIATVSESDPEKAVRLAMEDTQTDIVLVFGSLYLVSEIRKLFAVD